VAPGIDFNAAYTMDYGVSLDDGQNSVNKRDRAIDLLDLEITIDSEKAGWWKGGEMGVLFSRESGSSFNEVMGDAQVSSNIDTGAKGTTAGLRQAWIKQDFNGLASAIVGLYDMNAEFAFSDNAGAFLNSSFGIDPVTGGNVPVSLYPRPGMGAIVKIMPIENLYIQGARFDGDPATRKLSSTEGYYDIAEVGVSRMGITVKGGFWQHNNLNQSASNKTKVNGLYAIAEANYDMRGVNIGGFLQYGNSGKKNLTSFDKYIGAGITLTGLLPTRGADVLGIAFNQATMDPSGVGNGINGKETVYEATYSAPITKWLTIQPDYQYIKNVGAAMVNPVNGHVFSIRLAAAL